MSLMDIFRLKMFSLMQVNEAPVLACGGLNIVCACVCVCDLMIARNKVNIDLSCNRETLEEIHLAELLHSK